MFEEIRREYEFGVGTIAGMASKLKVHRRMVREAIGCALARPRKKTERPRWKIAVVAGFINDVLETDRKVPRKQRHTIQHIVSGSASVPRYGAVVEQFSGRSIR